MANRYWVGGTGNWGDTSSWSASSGGASGASIPTSADDVFIDINSGLSGGTINETGTVRCNNFTSTTGVSYSINYVDSDLGVYGNVVLEAGVTFTDASWLLFYNTSPSTLTSNGADLFYLYKNSTGSVTTTDAITLRSDLYLIQGSITLGGNLTTSDDIYVVGGTLDFNGYDVTVSDSFNINDRSSTATVNFGSGTINSKSVFIDKSDIRDLTINLESCTWNMGYLSIYADSGTLYTGNLTFNSGTGSIVIDGDDWSYLAVYIASYFDFTIANLTLSSGYRAGSPNTGIEWSNDNVTITNLVLNSDGDNNNPGWLYMYTDMKVTNLTINGDSNPDSRFELVGKRVLLSGGTTPSTITSSGTITATNANFRAISAAGSADWDLSSITGGSGDAGLNENIIFTDSQTNYWVGDSGSWGSSSHWSSTSGGTGGTGRVPLPQDTSIVDSKSFSAPGFLITADVETHLAKDVDFSDCQYIFRFNLSEDPIIYGSLLLNKNVFMTNGGGPIIYFRGSGSHVIDWNQNPNNAIDWIYIEAFGGTYTLVNDLPIDNSETFYIKAGTFDADIYNIQAGYFSITGSFYCTVNMGSGTWESTGGSTALFNIGTTTYLTLNCETSTVKFTGTLTANRNFTTKGQTFYNVWNASPGTQSVNILNGPTIYNLRADPGCRYRFKGGDTVSISNATLDGTADNLIYLQSSSGSVWYIVCTSGQSISGDYLYIQYSNASPVSSFFAGDNSTDGGNNTGWAFSASWTRESETSTTWTDESETLSSWTDTTKQSASWSGESKNSTSWADESETSSTWTN